MSGKMREWFRNWRWALAASLFLHVLIAAFLFAEGKRSPLLHGRGHSRSHPARGDAPTCTGEFQVCPNTNDCVLV